MLFRSRLSLSISSMKLNSSSTPQQQTKFSKPSNKATKTSNTSITTHLNTPPKTCSLMTGFSRQGKEEDNTQWRKDDNFEGKRTWGGVIEREPTRTKKREQHGSGGNKRGNTKGCSEKRPPWLLQSHTQASPVLCLCFVLGQWQKGLKREVAHSLRVLFELQEKWVCECE